MTRPIGRLRSEASPVKAARRSAWPAIRPSSSRAPVPALPKSSSRRARAKPPTPTPRTRQLPSRQRSTVGAEGAHGARRCRARPRLRAGRRWWSRRWRARPASGRGGRSTCRPGRAERPWRPGEGQALAVPAWRAGGCERWIERWIAGRAQHSSVQGVIPRPKRARALGFDSAQHWHGRRHSHDIREKVEAAWSVRNSERSGLPELRARNSMI